MTAIRKYVRVDEPVSVLITCTEEEARTLIDAIDALNRETNKLYYNIRTALVSGAYGKRV